MDLKVTYGQMNDAAKQLNTGETTITDDLNRLQTLISHLVQDGFVTTQASGAFDESYTQFTHGATQMIAGLNGLASYLNSAVQAMQQTDEQLASAIRSS